MNFKSFSLYSIIILLLLSIAGYIISFDKTIYIGTLNLFDENNFNNYVSMSEGIRLAFDEYEDLSKNKFELLRLDNVLEDSNIKKVSSIICSNLKSKDETIIEISKKQNIPIIVSSNSVDNIDENNIFQINLSNKLQGIIMSYFCINNLKYNTAGIIFNKDKEYSVETAEAFKNDFEKRNGKVLNFNEYSKNGQNLKSIIEEIAKNKPQLLFIPDDYNNLIEVSNIINEINFDTVIVGVNSFSGIEKKKIDNISLKDVYFCTYFSIDDNEPLIQDFVRRYEKKYKKIPDVYSAFGYDSAVLLIESIEKSDKIKSQNIIEKISNTNKEFVTGRINFKDNLDKKISIIKIEDNENILFEKLDIEDIDF